jgi:hypothetical protein
VQNLWVPPAKPGAPATFTDGETVNEVLRRASRNYFLGIEARSSLRTLTESMLTVQAQQAAILAAVQGLDTDAITASINEAVDKARKSIEAMQISVTGGDVDA